MLLHEGFEQPAQVGGLFVALLDVSGHGEAGREFGRDIGGYGDPQREPLDIAAGAPRQQHRQFKRGFHCGHVLGGYQDRLHSRISAFLRPAMAGDVDAAMLIPGRGQRKLDQPG